MSEKSRYYWLKLPEDFFDDDTIDFIENQQNGEKYCLFYLKLCLKALKSEGKLIRYVGEMLMPYDERGLSKLTNTDVDTVRSAVSLFAKIGLIKILDTGEIYLTQLNEMVGNETDKAKLMRKKRLQKRQEKEREGNNVTNSGNNVTQMLPECYTEIEIEIEKELDKDKEIELEIDKEDAQAPDQEKKLAKSKQKKQKTEKHKYGEYENVLLSDDEYKKLVDKVGNEKADAVIKNFSELKEMKGYTYKSDYLALLKWGIRAYEEQNSRTGSGKNGRFNKESLADRDFFAGTEYEGATA